MTKITISNRNNSAFEVSGKKPLLNELNETCYKKLEQVTVEDIYSKIKKNAKKNNKENLDFVI